MLQQNRARGSRGETLFERAERGATYVMLVTIILGELLAHLVSPVKSALDSGGATILLAGAVLLVFRLIDRLASTAGTGVEQADFATAVSRLFTPGRRISRVCIFADSGTKYYQSLSDFSHRIDHVSVLLIDPRGADNWHRLRERGVVGTVEVRQCAVAPLLHYMTVSGAGAMFGLFLRSPGHASAFRTFVASASARDQPLIEALQMHFDSEWAQVAHEDE